MAEGGGGNGVLAHGLTQLEVEYGLDTICQLLQHMDPLSSASSAEQHIV